MRKTLTAAILAAATGVALLASAGAASARVLPGLPGLSAFPVSATAITMITNDPDNGHGTPSEWAIDSPIMRTVTVTRGAQVPLADCGVTSGVCYAYTMSLRDTGSFDTIPGAGTPNQSCTGCAGEHIARQVTGSLNGTYSVTFDASSGSPDGTLVAVTHNDHGVAASPPYTSTTWGEQFFPGGTSFGNVDGGAYNWTYTVLLSFPRQQWTDSSANNDGNAPGDGNVTG